MPQKHSTYPCVVQDTVATMHVVPAPQEGGGGWLSSSLQLLIILQMGPPPPPPQLVSEYVYRSSIHMSLLSKSLLLPAPPIPLLKT